MNITLIPTKEYLQFIIYFTNQVDNTIKNKIKNIITLFLKNFKFLISQLYSSKLVTEDFDRIYMKFFNNDSQPFDYFFNKILSDLDKELKRISSLKYSRIEDSLKIFIFFMKNFKDNNITQKTNTKKQ